MSMTVPHQWIPEDDLLLKNAVEAGASLEFLAKGAVKFSRRFTLDELQERWSSLLYDPIVSENASALMVEMEHSAFVNPSKPIKSETTKEITCGLGKRGSGSVRRFYHAMRKRIRGEPFGVIGVPFLPGPGNFTPGDCTGLSSECVRAVDQHSGNVCGIRDCALPELDYSTAPPTDNIVTSSFNAFERQLQDPQLVQNEQKIFTCPYQENNTGMGGAPNQDNAPLEIQSPSSFGSSFLLPQLPNWNTSQEVPPLDLPIYIGEEQPRPGETIVRPMADSYLAELSNTFLDFTVEDELLFMGNDGEEILDKSYFDDLKSLLTDSPNAVDLPNAGSREALLAADEHSIISGGRPSAVDLGSQNTVVYSHEGLSSLHVEDFGPEYSNGVIYCALNTEDPEVPDNDDVFLPFRCPSPPHSPGVRGSSDDPNHLVSSDISTGLLPLHTTVSSRPSDMDLKYPTGDYAIKLEFPRSNMELTALRNARNSEHPSYIHSANEASYSFISGGVGTGAMKMELTKNSEYESHSHFIDKNGHGSDILQGPENNATCKLESQTQGYPDLDCSRPLLPMPINRSLLPEQEDPSSEDDFDFCLPYFSEIESLVLDMDFSPDGFDLLTCPEVQLYQHEETKRTIIRLEQSSNACMKNAMSRQGAYAILYGRCFRHFIKKPEVIIGRATEDNKVDIDLGREKHGSKISRRQAIVKMDQHGTFHMKNLGKSSIFINGIEVEKEQSLSLTSGCLIQIRELDFVIETNDRKIKQHLATVKDGSLVPSDKSVISSELYA